MDNLIEYTTYDDIAAISLNHPPVNALGAALRSGIMQGFNKAHSDSGVNAIIITSKKTIFCAGADISEFGNSNVNKDPALPYLLNVLEESNKPIIAAVDGAALGGGLELALACDFRIASTQATFGLPEVKLGIIPGAGGTQRLPRFIDVEKALNMIVFGETINANDALACGILDRLVDKNDDFFQTAIAYVRELIDNKAPVHSCAAINIDPSKVADDAFTGFRNKNAGKIKNLIAPECAIQAIEAACTLPLAAGLERETELFNQCASSSQARALQHLFFAERNAVKVSGVTRDTAVRKINKIGIVGAGTMGGGIAMGIANAGIPVLLVENDAQALERGLNKIKENYNISVQWGRLSQAQAGERINLIRGTLGYEELADLDMVIEAVFEDMEIKRQVFRSLDRICKPGAILATNTSTLDVDKIALVTSRPGDVIGTHFFSPANVMRLLELVRGRETDPSVIKSTLTLAKSINKIAVISGVCWGFIGNRMLEPYAREATRLLLEGAAPAQVDNVLTGFGMAMGFLSMIDLAGIDVGYLTRQGNPEMFAGDPGYQAICNKLYTMGRYGQKTGRGFYLYEGRKQSEDPEVMTLATQIAKELNISRRNNIDDNEIRERTLFMLINEGARVLEERIACRAGDIDLVFVNGYGFPAWRGGPMHYADEVGLEKILAAINGYHEQLGEYGDRWFKPAPLLERLVLEGQSFREYDAMNVSQT